MAGNAVIGALRVVLGADTAALDKGLKDAQSSLSRFAGQMKNVGLVAAGALAGVVGGAGVAIRSALHDADKLGKLAQSVGLPVEELSKLKHAADLSDVSLESLGKSIVKLSRNMSEVAGGNTTGAAAQAFKALGISVTDASGHVKSSDTILSEVADKFAKYRDGANKTALAVALFGRAGAEMIPMLNGGSAALREAKEEAEQFGLVVDKRTAAAAEAFNDNLTRMGKVVSGVWTQIAAKLAPALSQMSEAMVTAAKNADTLRQVSIGLEIAVKAVASAVLVAVYAYKQFATFLQTVIAAAIRLGNLDLSGAWDEIKSGMEQVKGTALETADSFQKLWTPPDTSGWHAALQASNDAIKEAIANGERFLELQKRDAPALPNASENAVQSYLNGLQKREAAMKAEIATIGLSEAAQQRLRIQMEATEIARQKEITLTPQVIAGINKTAESYGQLAERLQEARERWQFVEGAISTVASGLTDIVTRTKTAGEAFKSMALSIIRDFTQMIIKAQLYKAATAFMGGLGGGGFGGGGAVAGAYSMGGVPVPVIGSYAGGFASGGSFKVPPGFNEDLISFSATAGERVSVTKDGGYPGGGKMDVHVSLDNAMLRAVVMDESGKIVAQAAPQIVSAAVDAAGRALPTQLSEARRRGL